MNSWYKYKNTYNCESRYDTHDVIIYTSKYFSSKKVCMRTYVQLVVEFMEIRLIPKNFHVFYFFNVIDFIALRRQHSLIKLIN